MFTYMPNIPAKYSRGIPCAHDQVIGVGLEVDQSGTVEELGLPSAVAFDSAGHLFVAGNKCVVWIQGSRVTVSGKVRERDREGS